MLAVIEACSFQDITGQRIAKVVEVLEQIEKRVARFAAATRVADADGYASEHEAAIAGRRQRLLLHGPADESAGNGQGDVDFLLATKVPTVTQTEIDKLFG
jgi:chemotaxis protein CheZ